ncbi:hypothetical protein M408DRAFT_301122 [Serendipita vermifera MAFF 305830]|uniref:Protein kinase domain-containing protein n=1 Tax=Serendipita vermifera MAFF 305830 TaxID=933852 RepID=A0A0C2WWP0_SERVB|nr:hypothetical protein M408DRAFT_301122 [Serendipita vermifera MAFF 305830]
MDTQDETPDLSGEVQVLSHRAVFIGPYSTVYRGRLITDKQLVAIKVLNPIHGIPMNTIRRKVNRERWTWSQLHHPNILPLYGFADGEELFEPFGAFISPWCARGDMAQYLREHGPQAPLDERMNLWRGVVAGVEYLHLHAPNIVHGDLKPGNVLINDAGNAQICDFGLVKIFLEQGSTGMTTTTAHTGTERYLAYELIMGEESNPTMASDIYAVGCIGLELLFLEVPYSNRGRGLRWHLLDDMRSGMPPASRPVNLPDENEELWDLLLACWERTPYSRPSATALFESLEDALAIANLSGPQGSPRASAVKADQKDFLPHGSAATTPLSTIGDHLQSTMAILQLEHLEEVEDPHLSISNQEPVVSQAQNDQGHDGPSAVTSNSTFQSQPLQEKSVVSQDYQGPTSANADGIINLSTTGKEARKYFYTYTGTRDGDLPEHINPDDLVLSTSIVASGSGRNVPAEQSASLSLPMSATDPGTLVNEIPIPWASALDPQTVSSLPEAEIRRQTYVQSELPLPC